MALCCAPPRPGSAGIGADLGLKTGLSATVVVGGATGDGVSIIGDSIGADGSSTGADGGGLGVSARGFDWGAAVGSESSNSANCSASICFRGTAYFSLEAVMTRFRTSLAIAASGSGRYGTA